LSYVDVIAAKLLGDALGSPLEALFLPTFHPTVRLTLVDEWVDVAILGPAESFESCDVVVLPAEQVVRLLDDLDARARRPRTGGDDLSLVRDGMLGAIRVGELTLTGHFAIAGPDDPLVVIATDFLRVTLTHAQQRSTVRTLEGVSAYLDGFERDVLMSHAIAE
jgi:hypothetical protein